MATKDRGDKKVKKQAKKSLKEKRAAKKMKKSGGDSPMHPIPGPPPG